MIRSLDRILEEALNRTKPPSRESIVRKTSKGYQVLVWGGSTIDLVKLAGWNHQLVLHQNFRLDGEVVVQLTSKMTGGSFKQTINGVEVKAGELYRLPAGILELKVEGTVIKRFPFEKKAGLSWGFMRIDAVEKVKHVDTVKPPQDGFMAAGPNSQKKANDAFFEMFRTVFRSPSGTDLPAAIAAFQEAHPGTQAAELTDVYAGILARAAYDDRKDELTPLDWGRLGNYYEESGIPERKWAMKKVKKEKYRARYDREGKEIWP